MGSRKILGLDLGVASIGWALIAEDESSGKRRILDLGSRIIPLSTDDKDEFSKGNAISKNQKRTVKRTQRKGYDRYQLRRKKLIEVLRMHDMFPGEMLMHLSSRGLYGLRDRAVKERIELPELGRLFYHLNQKRGYKSSRSDVNLDKKDTDYVAAVKSRHETILEAGLTIGQFFYKKLQEDEYYRIKQQIFPREAYIEEFDAICREQRKHHPQILTDVLIAEVRNRIIYYQRPLKSQKGLVSICEFEGKTRKNNAGKDVFTGPKVAPKSSPLFQVCKIWETVNTITLKNKRGEILEITIEKKREIFDCLNVNIESSEGKILLDKEGRLSQAELFKILGLKKDDGWYGNKQTARGIQGNLTKLEILKRIPGFEGLLQFDLQIEENEKQTFLADRRTGEVKVSTKSKSVSATFEQQPFYRLWHIIYSISDANECVKALQENFSLPLDIAQGLINIDFTKAGFGNKSAKAMRNILPYLMDGYVYSEACELGGYNHSDSTTAEERRNRETATAIELLKKNSLRQPVVEKILNQLINLVNAIIAKHGRFGSYDEIRIELARELKQSKDERNDASLMNSANESINVEVVKRLHELGVAAKKRTIEKYKFVFPIRTVYKKDGSFDRKGFDNAQVANQCIYCGGSFSLKEALSGHDFDVDHIIPQSLLFDDSQTNRVLVHRKCNAEDKKNKTAYDFIRSKGDAALKDYLERLDEWFGRGVLSFSKLERLKVSHEDYLERKLHKKETEADKKLWENFIERQMRETQYIARKSKEILEQVCNNVWNSSGTVTAYVRRIWGWDDVLMNLQLPKYKSVGLTEWKEWETNDGQKRRQEVIKGWTKRDDHRHHAIDALAIACTKQGFIQRLNSLNASSVRDEMKKEMADARIEYNKRKSLLENYLYSQKPFTTKEVEAAAAGIIVSFKAGKRVTTASKYKAKGKAAESGVLVPRGPLSEESVYGKIRTIDKDLKTNEIKKHSVEYLFKHPDLIFKPKIRTLVEARLKEYEGDTRKALGSLKNDAIYLDVDKTKELVFGTCYKDEIVIKYELGTGQGKLFDGKETEEKARKILNSIVDKEAREKIGERLFDIEGKYMSPREAFKNLENDPVWFNKEKQIKIKTVRCFTGLTAVESVKKGDNGNSIGFVKPGNNHHVAIYVDQYGKKIERGCTFWHAVERKKYGLPVIIEKPKDIWEQIGVEEDFTKDFLLKIPEAEWVFVQSLQQNEMFVLGLAREDAEQAIKDDNKEFLSQYMYLVWSVSENNYWFRHHLETKNSELKKAEGAKESKRYYLCKSIGSFESLNPIKVKVNNLGEIMMP